MADGPVHGEQWRLEISDSHGEPLDYYDEATEELLDILRSCGAEVELHTEAADSNGVASKGIGEVLTGIQVTIAAVKLLKEAIAAIDDWRRRNRDRRAVLKRGEERSIALPDDL